MAGGDAERFCMACNRSVHDLSLLTRRQAADLFANNDGKLCGRIRYDERGNSVFAKERNPIERLMQVSLLGASVVASAAAAQNCEVKVRVVDPTGVVIPQAVVKISSAAGVEAVSSGASDDRGEFSSRLAPGMYSLQVQSPGFLSFQQALTCNQSESVSVAAPLQLGVFVGEVVEARPKPFLEKLPSLFRRH